LNRFPSFSQWKQIFKVLTEKEKIILSTFFLLTVISLIFLIANLYFGNTKAVPALGGAYTEGIVGQPRLINPIYSETSDIDRTLVDLVFSSLITYNNHGELVEDLVKSYEVSNDGKVYQFILKDNIFWHDGKELTADDIVFTIKTIQNSDYKSPLRANWIDVNVEKTSNKSVRFVLKSLYSSFLENLTVKVIPKHIWENISPENFALSPYNLQPVGSGPYRFSDVKQSVGFIKSIDLESNRKYYRPPSYIEKLSFQFFESKESLMKAVNDGYISGFALASLDDNILTAEKEVNSRKFHAYSLLMPRYFAVFFNTQKSSIFHEANMRKAMVYAVNKDELIENIRSKVNSRIARVDSPILPNFFDYKEPNNVYNFDKEKADSLLDKTGFLYNGSGLREKALKKEAAFQFKSYLKVGSKGTEVTQLQTCLARLDENLKNILLQETSGSYTKVTESAVTEFQKKYLPDLDPTGETGVSTRAKLNELCITPQPNSQTLKFTLTTVNQPQLIAVANLLKSYWQSVGVAVEINALPITELKPTIKTRSYEALLYGEALGSEPDLYPFWHSSQKFDPGLNLSSYENKDVDKLLKEARETMDDSIKATKYESLQEIIINDAPALFLYNPDYVYWVSPKIKGIDTEKIIDPAKRFSNITQWFVKTKRVWN